MQNYAVASEFWEGIFLRGGFLIVWRFGDIVLGDRNSISPKNEFLPYPSLAADRHGVFATGTPSATSLPADLLEGLRFPAINFSRLLTESRRIEKVSESPHREMYLSLGRCPSQ